jgi:hypothetical protein
MTKKIVLSLLIIISLVACSDKNYITGQVGPSRGIVFNVDGNDIEAIVYTDDDTLDYSTAKKVSDDYEVKSTWKKVYSNYRLPTEEELLVISKNKYFAALDVPATDLLWSDVSDIQYNYKTKEIIENSETASLLLVRDIN